MDSHATLGIFAAGWIALAFVAAYFIKGIEFVVRKFYPKKLH